MGSDVLFNCPMMESAPFENDELNKIWIKNINRDEKFALHRACCSYQPLKEVILGILEANGIADLKTKNEAGITPSQYLHENPYADIQEMEIIRDYIAKQTGNFF